MKQEYLSQAPDMIGQSGGHGRCPWLPLYDYTRPGDGLGQWQAQAGMGQTEVVVHMEQGQLLTQPSFVFAQRVDPPTDRRHMLAKVQVEALYNPTATLVEHSLLAASGKFESERLCSYNRGIT
jgi:hypothetical protein